MPTAPIDQFDELPRIKGPKLNRFNEGRHGKIEYLELISSPVDEAADSSDEVHGYVFSVRIDSKRYALKIFRFFDPEETRGTLGPFENSRISDEDIVGQTDPFYAECRAYGRIKERRRKRPIAVPCHGFISIPATKEPFFKKKFGITDWNRPEEELSQSPAKRQPFRALVKDLVEKDPEVSEVLIRSMLRELKALHSLRIYVMDIAWRNYKGGHVVDFSSAWTEPCFDLQRNIRPAWEIGQKKREDLYEFDDMVEELGVHTSVRAAPNEEYTAMLRPRRGKRK